jgi:cell division protein FtsB
MTTINNIEDLIRILDENPEWVEAVRTRLLTRELLDLPQVVAGLAQRTDEQAQTIAEQAQTIADLSQTVADLSQQVADLSQQVADLSQQVADLVTTVNELANDLRATNRRLDRLQDDVGWLKGRIIYDIVRNDAALIADEMGFRLEQTLARADLRRLSELHDVSDLSRGEMLSFHRADLVMKAADNAGNPHYIAVEASFTVNGRDSRRALRNTELLTRFTGLPAMAAVAGVRYDRDLKDQVESKQLHWYEIPAEDLETE